ncbi:hypothetical protein FGG08_004156 [Glutinoglossum americanum]|uniref:Uncharacterized protein n=1 Tax=Glutinoglossum americanum TaxID=1670608 RepID=A0A9P8I6B2_9PEZI|nr:hypothetical protein FGG08_004156 [Glutinoglossum americanum]
MADSSYIPLTTIFTPPPECSTRLFTINIDSTSSFNADYMFWEDMIQDAETLTCYPPIFSDYWPSTFSPGVCPSDYTTFATTVIESESVTVATCCPSRFTATSVMRDNANCQSKVGSPTIALVQSMCDGVTRGRCTGYEYLILGTTTVTPSYAIAYPYTVAWKQADLDIFSPKSAPLLRTSGVSISSYDYTAAFTEFTLTDDFSTTSMTSSPRPPPAGPTTRTTATASGNSTGGHGGLGPKQQRIAAEVGGVIGALIVLAGCAWLLLRPKLRRRGWD